MLKSNGTNDPVDVSLMGGIVNSLANPTQNQTALVNGCSTGNCTFPMINGITHSTIGMCSQCIGITSKLQDTSNYTDVGDYISYVQETLPNGLSLEGWVDSGMVLNASGVLGYSNLQLDGILIPSSVFDWTMITVSAQGCSPPCDTSDMETLYNEDGFLSTACSIYPCMRHYAGLVDRGEFNETLISTVPALPASHDDGVSGLTPYYVGVDTSCVIDGKTHELTMIQPSQIEISQGFVFLTLDGANLTLPSQCINEIHGDYVSSVVTFLNDVLTGSCLSNECSGGNGNMWWLQGALNNPRNATLDTVQSTFDSVVESITNRMRVQGYDPRTNSTGLAYYGSIIQTTTCIAVSWGWLLFPASLTILTVLGSNNSSTNLRKGENSIREIFDFTSSICTGSAAPPFRRRHPKKIRMQSSGLSTFEPFF
jgi:hypothetical protein